MNFTESEFDAHFTDRKQAEKLAKMFNGRVRNNSYRLHGSTQSKKKTDHYAVRIKPRSFAHKIEIVEKAKELGSVKNPWN